MAGDWIKMRGNLWDDPRVSALVDATESSEAAVVGGLYWLWATADQHTETGVMPGLTLRQIDRKTGVPGLAEALCRVGWIADHPDGIHILNFEDHNGESAKRRSVDAKRKQGVRKVSAPDADISQTDSGQPRTDLGAREREEKSREEKKETKPLVGAADDASQGAPQGDKPAAAKPGLNDYPDDFEIAWASYPKRPGMNKKESYKAYAARVKAGHDPTLMLAGVQRYAKFCVGTDKVGTEYVKQPATFFGPNEHFNEDWNFVAPVAKGPVGAKHGSLATQNYRAGIAPDGSF